MKELMHDITKVMPGTGIKKVLLYFPNVKEYMIWNKPHELPKPFRFTINNSNGPRDVSDYPSLWIELEE